MKLKINKKYVTRNSTERLHECSLPLLAITGGIATGKSTVTKLIQSKGINVICADQLIKIIYKHQKTKDWIEYNFNNCIQNNIIDFTKLREIAFREVKNREKLESFLYPELKNLFNEEVKKIINEENQNFIIYDIPLLFEKNFHDKFDLIICVYASKEIQIERLIKRDNINVNLALEMLKSQIDIEDKKNKSDYIITNTSELSNLTESVDNLLKNILD